MVYYKRKSSEFEDITLEIIQNETQEKNDGMNKVNRRAITCQASSKNPRYIHLEFQEDRREGKKKIIDKVVVNILFKFDKLLESTEPKILIKSKKNKQNKTIPMYIIIKLLKTYNKYKIRKSFRDINKQINKHMNKSKKQEEFYQTSHEKLCKL